MVIAATIRLQREPFDAAAETAALTQGRTDIGAVVAFTGICRGAEDGAPIAALTLEHYPGMAEAEIVRHVEEAQSRWALLGVTVIHRYGRIAPGEPIVLVLTASSHRQDAFAAAEFLMDYLKARAPFWKQVEAAGATSWVEAKESDDSAAERWQSAPSRGRDTSCLARFEKKRAPDDYRGAGSHPARAWRRGRGLRHGSTATDSETIRCRKELSLYSRHCARCSSVELILSNIALNSCGSTPSAAITVRTSGSAKTFSRVSSCR